jgi:3D (Asp-Asp-Asp) domain-containing protein
MMNVNAVVSHNMKIRVARVKQQVVVSSEPVNFKTVVKFNPQVSERKVVQEGKKGERGIKYVVTYQDGKKVGQKVVDTWINKKPVNQVVVVPKPVMLASRGEFGMRSIRMVATAYAPFACGGSSSGRAALGMPARKGVAAVDPRIIPLGSKLYIEGYGYAVAGDTGGAIKGGRIDLCFNTYSEAIRYGRHTVTVYILQ